MSKNYPRDISKRILKSSLKTYSKVSKSNIKKQSSAEKSNVQTYSSEESSSTYSSDTSHLFPVISLLEKLNFKYEVIPDAQTKQNCFFMQDAFMNAFYKYYPEYVCFDVLCEIPPLDHNLVLFIGLDTNGHCEVVSIGFIKSGKLQGFSWLCEVFKKHNPQWSKIEFIASDQNNGCREILSEAFTCKPVFISFFHSMKSFKKDLSNLDPTVTSQDIQKALQIFEHMIFITSESGYLELQKQMKQLSPYIFNIFRKNWHVKKELWTLGMYFDSKMFLKTFNSFLLNIRKKLKPVISSQESLENVIHILHSGLVKFRKEWFQKFTCVFQSPSISCSSKSRVMKKYSKFLTPYATELVNEQLEISGLMKNIQKIDQNTYAVNGSETIVSFNTCYCSFHTLMMLPCCHIFAVRNFLSLPLFVDSLRSSWIAAKYQSIFLDLYSNFILNDKREFVSVEQVERFSQCIDASHEMWNLMLDCNEDISQERLETFQNVLKAWKNNFKITVQVSEKQTDSSCSNGEALENLSTDNFKEMYGISLNDILDSENDFSSVSLCSESANDLL